MSKKNKFNAQGVWHDLKEGEELLEAPSQYLRRKNKGRYHYFSSNLEYEVFLELLNRFTLDEIELKPKLTLKPPTLSFPRITWEVDFKVKAKNEVVFVEAKGWGTREFKLKIALLEYLYPEIFKHLLLVFPETKLSKNQFLRANKVIATKAVSFKQFQRMIKNGSLHSSVLRAKNNSDVK